MSKYFFYCVIAVLLSVIIQQCRSGRKNREIAITNYYALTDTLSIYKNRLGGYTASVKTLQLEKSELKKMIIEKDKDLQQLSKEFSEIKSIFTYKTVTHFDTIQVIYEDSIPCMFNHYGHKLNKWYSFTYKSNQQGFAIDSLKIWAETNIITGFKRKWFLGKETITTDITVDNPHIVVTGVNAAEVSISEPWYRKWYLWLAAGLLGGIAIAN